MSGLGANFEVDLKKVIALSTLSQLGLMIMVLRLGAPNLAFFHLIMHALFKSALFMCAGVFIHSLEGNQDFRGERGFGRAAPRLILVARTSNLALCGFPFLAGFFSKDLVIEATLIVERNTRLFIFLIIRAGLTISYRLRFIFKRVNEVCYLNSVSGLIELDWGLFKRISILAFFRVIGGFVGFWAVLGSSEPIFLRGPQKYSIVFIILVGVVGGVFIFRTGLKFNINLKLIVAGATSMWFLPKLSTILRSRGSFVLGGSVQRLDFG